MGSFAIYRTISCLRFRVEFLINSSKDLLKKSAEDLVENSFGRSLSDFSVKNFHFFHKDSEGF